MPQIQTYNDNVLPQGGLNVQANPNDFGAQVGAATQNLGGAIGQAAQELHQYNTTQDVTNVHVNMAKARAEWTKTLQDRANQAQPGDETFAPSLMKDMQDYFQKFGESVTTVRGKQVFADLAANMTSEFGQRAIGIQGDLAAKDAVNKYEVLSKSIGATAYADQTQVNAAIDQGKKAIDDPNGMFGKIPQTARDKFKQQLENDTNFAAARGFVRSNPDAILQSISPDMLTLFDPSKKIVQANATPGSTVSISSGAMKWAPQVQVAAAKQGLNPNILLAQIDKESGGNHAAVGPMTRYGTAKGLAQFIDSTAQQYNVDVTDPTSSINGQAAYMADLTKKYGGDYSKALAAYNWGPGNMDSALQRWGNDWKNHLPAETSKYVSGILLASGAVGDPNLSPQQTPAVTVDQAPARAPVSSSIKFMNDLTWEQQDHIVNEAIQLKNMQMSMETRARELADYQLKKQRETTSGQFLTRIVDPENNGGTPTDQEIAADPVLSWQEKQHMVDYKLTRQRELAAGADAIPHPAEVRRLMLSIHAADDDPTKAYSFDPVMESYRNGSLNTGEMKMLRTEVEQMRSGDGNSFGKQMQMAREKAYGTFVRSFEASLPGGSAMANDAYYRFTTDLNAKSEALRKENKDPTTLLDPKSRDYMLSPERLQSYWPNATTILAQQAGKTAQATLPAGTVKDGYRFKGGNPADKNNWEKN